MENIAKNPGLLHIAEKIFLQLNYEDLMAFRLVVDQSCKASLDKLMTVMFWFKKWIQRGLSKKNQSDWKRAIHWRRNTYLEKMSHFYMFTIMIFREEISISWAFWSGKNHFCLLQPVQKSFPISPEILFQECLFTFCM